MTKRLVEGITAGLEGLRSNPSRSGATGIGGLDSHEDAIKMLAAYAMFTGADCAIDH